MHNFVYRVAFCLIGILFLALAVASSMAQVTAAQWQEDVRFLQSALERQHPNPYRRNKKEVFDTAARRLIDSIPSMPRDEISVGLMRLMALVQDGHTSLFPPELFQKPVFPLRFYLFEDGLYIIRAPKQYTELVGSRVLSIARVDVAEALKQAFEIVAADNDMGRRENAPVILAVPDLLSGLKINTDKTRLPLKVEIAGGVKNVDITPAGTLIDLLQSPAGWTDAGRSEGKTPLYLRDPRNSYWFEYDKEHRLVYLQQNAVQNKDNGESLSDFYKRVLDVVAANPVDKLVIDLRQNGGGNNGLNTPLIRGIIKSKVDEPGHLFVITGRITFSAAQNYVNALERYTTAIFVGEPTGEHPNGYGDARPVELPNSKLTPRISTLYWQDLDPRDARQWTAPQIATPLTFADYRNGVDPALQAIINYKPASDLTSMIASAKSSTDISPFIRQLEEFVRDPQHKYVDTEAPINRLGYDLLAAKRTTDAVEVFKLNAKMHPASANVFDSLGDGYQAVNNKDEAIKAYEKALSIDPAYPSSRDALKKLRGQ
jgi:hypothetical protein